MIAESLMTDIDQLVCRARQDPEFQAIHEVFSHAGVQSWLQEDEKALLFAIGAYAEGSGVVVEIGSFQGGSACFLAAGIRRRATGVLHCVDPHLGGPPWLGLGPAQRTLNIFTETLRFCGLEEYVRPRLGDSYAIAAVWPAQEIDAVLIDGDHSFRGVLKDFESWATKVRPGGFVLIDDADDAVLSELGAFIELIKQLQGVRYLTTIEGIAIFFRTVSDPWELLQELRTACESRQIHRPWDYRIMHQQQLPANFRQSNGWLADSSLGIAYQLCFLARCGAGPYGFTPTATAEDRKILYALSRDRNDGDVVQVDESCQNGVRFRAILCSPEESACLAPLLLPGGVLIARETSGDSVSTRSQLLEAGLGGCGFGDHLHWGVRRPDCLSPDAIIELAIQSHRGRL